ncbi:unnamed protein product [Toxocara canis]|uniref:Type II toxin-antitoxin system HicB family antitoxin n=1 Tax=Toxocara canis TaxID=6265 RepID=A0A183U5L9_TOXCA|nr:unnamed protein product [Toxocara canis]
MSAPIYFYKKGNECVITGEPMRNFRGFEDVYCEKAMGLAERMLTFRYILNEYV